MTTSHHVPSDDEAETILSLVHDCREISGLLGSFVPTVIRVPEARGPAASDALGVMPVDISALVAAGLDGYDEYGS